MSNRVPSVDALRAFALFGIAVVNMPFLAAPFGVLTNSGSLDTIAAFITALLFQGKFFLIFAFLFGWGVGVQLDSAQAKAVNFRSRFFRRQLGLLLIGALHATLVFSGDILVLYGLVGILLYAMRHRSARALLISAGISLIVAVAVLIILAILISSEGDTGVPMATGYLGGWQESIAARIADLPITFSFIVMFNGPMVFAAFCAGLAAHRSGFLKLENALFAKLHRYRWLILIAGLLLNLPFATVGMNAEVEDPLLALAGFASLPLAAPVLSLAYIVFVASWANANASDKLAAAGRMSLTAYVAEGFVGGLIFNGYGLGLYGQMGSAAVFGIAMLVCLVVELACALWNRSLGQGPLERVLRRIASHPRAPATAKTSPETTS